MTCEQLSGCCGMSMLELGELVGYSALVPIANGLVESEINKQERWLFSARWLAPLRAVCKLRNDFDLDMFAVAMLLVNLQRIDELEEIVRTMQLEMHRITQLDAHPTAQLERGDPAQFDLFSKKQNVMELI